jgi:hypothetical protein
MIRRKITTFIPYIENLGFRMVITASAAANASCSLSASVFL